MFLNMGYALPLLQWLLRTVSPYSAPDCPTVLQDHRNAVSLRDLFGLKPCPDLSPNPLALRIACGTEKTLIHKEDTTPLMKCPVFVPLVPS
ncbi:hypothetical protein TNCV_3229781 [Trichonephila clavipes]|nr:hypothetical protein TNCV_3229781 [Trichonephila clavipes]